MASLVRKLRPSSVLTVVVETKDSLSSYEYSLVVEAVVVVVDMRVVETMVVVEE